MIITIGFVLVGLAMVPTYAKADSIINLVQELYGLLSMPILSAFIVGLLFRDVAAGAAIMAVVLGVLLYGYFSFVWALPLHPHDVLYGDVLRGLCVAGEPLGVSYQSPVVAGDSAQLINSRQVINQNAFGVHDRGVSPASIRKSPLKVAAPIISRCALMWRDRSECQIRFTDSRRRLADRESDREPEIPCRF